MLLGLYLQCVQVVNPHKLLESQGSLFSNAWHSLSMPTCAFYPFELTSLFVILGLEASIADKKKNDISLEDVKIVIKSRDDDKIHVSDIDFQLDAVIFVETTLFKVTSLHT